MINIYLYQEDTLKHQTGSKKSQHPGSLLEVGGSLASSNFAGLYLAVFQPSICVLPPTTKIHRFEQFLVM